MPCVWTAQVLGHLLGSDKGIMWCRQVTPAVKAEMGQILKDAQGKKVVTAKRPSDAAATAIGLASAAATVAASKRARSSVPVGLPRRSSGRMKSAMTPGPPWPWPT